MKARKIWLGEFGYAKKTHTLFFQGKAGCEFKGVRVFQFHMDAQSEVRGFWLS